MLDDEWHEIGNPQSPKKFCELAPEKIAWRWRILHHAYALVVDGVAGTHFAEKYFANFDGANAAARIADYCRRAIGRMKPGDEPAIIREAIRMAKLQDFLSLQKLMVNLEQIRKGPGAASRMAKKDLWLEFLDHTGGTAPGGGTRSERTNQRHSISIRRPACHPTGPQRRTGRSRLLHLGCPSRHRIGEGSGIIERPVHPYPSGHARGRRQLLGSHRQIQTVRPLFQRRSVVSRGLSPGTGCLLG